ncbi:hypothetical protein GX50_06534 [[Emmonsia] crescens]|uniref:Uncharacterized protein n=1 Tax=[Emmonsia] crescens TaxID=73230 RepID=A0A2B7ZBG1_9EURO|nr:hypothetical protein GX50_06534 [Emmonsia crescens]
MQATRYGTHDKGLISCHSGHWQSTLFGREPTQVWSDHADLQLERRDAAHTVNNFRPEIAFLQSSSTLNSSPNRRPGDLEVSWKWRAHWVTALSPEDHRECKQVLSQVNFYMKQQQRTIWLHLDGH